MFLHFNLINSFSDWPTYPLYPQAPYVPAVPPPPPPSNNSNVSHYGFGYSAPATPYPYQADFYNPYAHNPATNQYQHVFNPFNNNDISRPSS